MKTELENFNDVWEHETAKTIKLLQCLPRDGYDFRPDPEGRSLGELAWHLAEAEAAFKQTILRAMEDVENSLASYGRDQNERDRLAHAVSAEERAVDLADSRYRAGLDSFLAVLDAQRTLRDGEDRLAAAETRVAVSAISVYKALGGGASQ